MPPATIFELFEDQHPEYHHLLAGAWRYSHAGLLLTRGGADGSRCHLAPAWVCSVQAPLVSAVAAGHLAPLELPHGLALCVAVDRGWRPQGLVFRLPPLCPTSQRKVTRCSTAATDRCAGQITRCRRRAVRLRPVPWVPTWRQHLWCAVSPARVGSEGLLCHAANVPRQLPRAMRKVGPPSRQDLAQGTMDITDVRFGACGVHIDWKFCADTTQGAASGCPNRKTNQVGSPLGGVGGRACLGARACVLVGVRLCQPCWEDRTN